MQDYIHFSFSFQKQLPESSFNIVPAVTEEIRGIAAELDKFICDFS